ncbi:MAG: IS6 family transposase, partial [Nitrososphaerales archaeon]
SAQWHADETMVKVKGRWMWKWNLMDRQTRLLIASIISENRDIAQARRLFRKAKALVRTKPDVIVTDGLQVYGDAIRKEFYSNSGRKTEHIVKSGFAGKRSNSIIERHNGTFKDWYKNRRGLKKVDSPLIEGRDIANNFVHSNQALGGMTAAEAAGADEHLGDNES